MKTKIVISLLAVVAVVAVVAIAQQKNAAKEDALFVKNLEALTFDEGGGAHGEIDTTLQPYSRLSEYQYWIPEFPFPTTIPCCEPDESPYSGCAQGLDRCP